MKLHRSVVPVLLVLVLAVCDDDPAEPTLERSDVSGTYSLTTFAFDPQGSLAAVDIKSQFATQIPSQMIVTTDGRLQFLAQPAGGLLITAGGTYTTTTTGINAVFDDNGPYRNLLLSRRMTFEFSQTAGTLTFSGPAPDGVPRARLLVFAPQFENEQLLDPTPGTLQITLTRSGT